MNIFGLTSRGLEVSARSLDLTATSAGVTASNIANVETPGFKAQAIDFDKVMSAVLKANREGAVAKTNPRHLPLLSLEKLNAIADIMDNGSRIDGNTVDMDREITNLSEMNLKYGAFSAITNRELGTLKSAIMLNAQ